MKCWKPSKLHNQSRLFFSETLTVTATKVFYLPKSQPCSFIFSDFGKRGQIVTVDDPIEAKSELILPGAAVYATPENLEKYKDIAIPEENFRFSSPYVKSVSPSTISNHFPILDLTSTTLFRSYLD